MRPILFLCFVASTRWLFASDPAAFALLDQVRAFVGGDAISAVDGVRVVGTHTTRTSMGTIVTDIDLRIDYPDTLDAELRTPFGTFTQEITPERAVLVSGERRKKLSAAEREFALLAPDAELLTVLKTVSMFSVTNAGTQVIDGRPVSGIDITGTTVRLRWWIDPSSGRVLQSERTHVHGAETNMFRDWTTSDGITLPRTIASTGATATSTHAIAALTIIRATPPTLQAHAPVPRPAPPPVNECDTTDCSITVRIIKGDGVPCASCTVMFTWSSGGIMSDGDSATRLTNPRGIVEFRPPTRYLSAIATIVNRTGLILPLRFNVDTLGGTELTITTPYTGR